MAEELTLTSCNNKVENGICYDLTGANPRIKVNVAEYMFTSPKERNLLAVEIANKFNSALKWEYVSHYRCQNYKHHHVILIGTK